MDTKHKYRVSVYLGKELYEKIEGLSIMMGIPIATCTKIILNTGAQISEMLESKIGGELNGCK